MRVRNEPCSVSERVDWSNPDGSARPVILGIGTSGVLLCETPIIRGKLAGQIATGTDAGYRRHMAAGEEPCDACREASRRASAKLRRKHRGSQGMGLVRKTPVSAPVKVTCKSCGRRANANVKLLKSWNGVCGECS